jgi:hypothetical protein
MLRCPRCQIEGPPGTKICKCCGSILDATEAAPRTDPMPDETRAPDGLTCWSCGEPFSPGFDVCWKCGADRQGGRDPLFVPADAPACPRLEPEEAADADRAGEDDARDEVVEPPAPHCGRCGSSKVLPNIGLSVVFYKDPAAIIWKQPFYGELAACVCGDCGHVDLRVKDPMTFYEECRRPMSPNEG